MNIMRATTRLSANSMERRWNRVRVPTAVCMMQLLLILSSWAVPVANLKMFEADGGCTISERDFEALSSLQLDGHLNFHDTSAAARDFGLLRSLPPAAILYPGSVDDIVAVVRVVYESKSNLTIAAKGPGHSVNGQGQALNGIVVEMSTLKGIEVNAAGRYIDATGGELWVNVLEAALVEGLSPRSFTDYLYLSVGGTLSNAGISGQSFRHGPQISNVLQLEVVTGTGERVTCLPDQNGELFFAALGGLGQFGIITKARIILHPAPQRVRWIRALYSDFAAFTRDQVALISQKDADSSFDYVEGFVVPNTLDSIPGWKSTHFTSQYAVNASLIPSSTTSPVLYYIELTKTYDHSDSLELVSKKVMELLEPLGHIPSFVYSTDVTYYDFLDRVHRTELTLRPRGEWDVPHPWINVLVPQSKIYEFDSFVFRDLLRSGITGPVLVYPFNREKWDARTSAVTPEEDVFYVVAFLQHVLKSAGPTLENLLSRNDQIIGFCETLGCKQYLPRYSRLSDWERHYGQRWPSFLRSKRMYDPLAILAPGQNMFARGQVPSFHSSM